MRQYIALIHKEAGSDYGVSFPDVPGCITAGSTLDEARALAEEALAIHVKGLAVRVNVTIPKDVLDRIDRYASDHGSIDRGS